MADGPVPKDVDFSGAMPVGASTETVLTGEHTVSDDIIRLNREWRPKDPSAQRFKDNVIALLEGIVNNTNTTVPEQGEEEPPDPPPGGGGPEMFYDSGYVPFTIGGSTWDVVEFPHNLGQVPTRTSIFYANVAEPDPNNITHEIIQIFPSLWLDANDHKIGSRLKVINKNSLQLTIAPNGLDGFYVDTTTDHRIPPLDGFYRHGFIRLMAWR